MNSTPEPIKFPPLLAEIFEQINIGLILLEKEPRRIVFANFYFEKIAREKETIIQDILFRDLVHLQENRNFRCDMEFENEFVIGYTIYKITENLFLAFLNDISYKKIFLENKGESHFYDRLSGLIAEVVHEMGNPLTALNTTLQVLYEYMSEWDYEKQRQYVKRAIDEIDRLSQYLDRMRKFSRIDSFSQQKTPLKPIIQKLIKQYDQLLAQKNISVTIELDDKLEVVVDEELFHQVVLNLLLNSIDILQEYGRIAITIDEVNEFFVKLSYQNNGPPIAPHLLEKIFIPFFTTKKNGSGIGLAVSMKLMVRMGGALKIETCGENWGVKFVLYVPVSRENTCDTND
jgi:signal transduction histidine kinase